MNPPLLTYQLWVEEQAVQSTAESSRHLMQKFFCQVGPESKKDMIAQAGIMPDS